MNKIFYSLVLTLALTGCGGGASTTINNNSGDGSSSDTSNDTASNNGSGNSDNGNTTTKPPAEQPPVETPPKEQPPKETPPKEEPPVEQPPKEEPPKETPPAEQPPVETPPKEEPPKEEPPVEEPPVDKPDGFDAELDKEYSHEGKDMVDHVEYDGGYGRPGTTTELCMYSNEARKCTYTIPSEKVVKLNGMWVVKDMVVYTPNVTVHPDAPVRVSYKRTVLGFSSMILHDLIYEVSNGKLDRVTGKRHFSKKSYNGGKPPIFSRSISNTSGISNADILHMSLSRKTYTDYEVIGFSPDGSKIYTKFKASGDKDGERWIFRTVEKVGDVYDPYNLFEYKE